MRLLKYTLIVVAVIAIDQTSKWLVYKHMYLHEEIGVIGDWFKLHYLLNPGMAFGFQWDSEFGKLALTLFRMVVMVILAFHFYRSTLKSSHPLYLVSLALILGGAIGNVIDSTFYGVWFENHLPGSPTPWFHGQVIDMLFFPLFDFHWPAWMPGIGGEYFLFFSPVFNIADSSIFIGVLLILVFQKRLFAKEVMLEPQADPPPALSDNIQPTHPPAEKREEPIS